MAMAIPVSVTCPACQQTIVAQVHNIIDVGQDPELKSQFLQGQLNVVNCPQCGQSGMLAMPLLYHDPDKELLLVFVPDQLEIKVEDREKMIGNLVNALIETIPAESRKAYLLQPKTYFSLDRMFTEILKADGITEEMLEAQRRSIELIDQFLLAKDDEEAFDKLLEEHGDALDYEFFMVMSAVLDAVSQSDEPEQAEDLMALREKLLAAVAPPIPDPLPEDASFDELLQAMIEAEDDQALRGVVVSNRGRIDYSFFQSLTARIEQMGEDAEETELTELRAKVLDITDEIDQRMEQAQAKRQQLVEQLMAAEDMEPILAENISSLDMLFFAVLGSMAAGADEEQAAKLQAVQRQVAAFIQDYLPDELRFLSQLIVANDDQIDALLEENGEMVNADFVEMIESMLADYQDRGEEASSEADTLRNVLAKVQERL